MRAAAWCRYCTYLIWGSAFYGLKFCFSGEGSRLLGFRVRRDVPASQMVTVCRIQLLVFRVSRLEFVSFRVPAFDIPFF